MKRKKVFLLHNRCVTDKIEEKIDATSSNGKLCSISDKCALFTSILVYFFCIFGTITMYVVVYCPKSKLLSVNTSKQKALFEST